MADISQLDSIIADIRPIGFNWIPLKSNYMIITLHSEISLQLPKSLVSTKVFTQSVQPTHYSAIANFTRPSTYYSAVAKLTHYSPIPTSLPPTLLSFTYSLPFSRSPTLLSFNFHCSSTITFPLPSLYSITTNHSNN